MCATETHWTGRPCRVVLALVALAAVPAAAMTLVLTQIPADASAARVASAGGMLPADFAEGARIVVLDLAGKPRVLSASFHSAADPEVSFDGTKLLFAGRKSASDPWDIWEIGLDGKGLRRVTRDHGNCRAPVYLGSFFTLDSPEPWNQIAFVSDAAGELNEAAPDVSTSLYTCRLDGSEIRRLTHGPSSVRDPTMLPDGRLLFSEWQRSTLVHGTAGRIALFAAQTDGLDHAIFSGDEGRRIKLMPAVTPTRQVVFVESDRAERDGAGDLAAVSLRRNLHSHRRITTDAGGLYHSPSALPDGAILVSRRAADGTDTHAVYRLDPATGRSERLFDDPRRHDVQARLAAARPKPDGRSTVVDPASPTGRIYGIDVYESDLGEGVWIKRGTPLRLRVLEGLPRHSGATAQVERVPPLVARRFLGEIPVESDGSFNVELPANVPLELQLVGDDGLALRTCGWIWVQGNEARGCIGCHEDGERAPPNRLVEAIERASTVMTPPPEERRGIDFRRDVQPILSARCAAAACHGAGGAPPRLDDEAATGHGEFNRAYVELLAGTWVDGHEESTEGRWIHPGRARTSPLIRALWGRTTERPWDAAATGSVASMPPRGSEPLTDREKRTFAEWIDLGALWHAAASEPPAGARK